MVARKKGERPKKKHYKKPAPKKTGDGPVPNPAADCAQYLQDWCSQSKGGTHTWKFNKSRQVFLLRHAYDADIFNDDVFKQLCEYVAGLPEGPARNKTIEQARAHADGRSAARTPAPTTVPPTVDPDNTAPDAAANVTPADAALDEARAEGVRRRACQMLRALGVIARAEGAGGSS